VDEDPALREWAALAFTGDQVTEAQYRDAFAAKIHLAILIDGIERVVRYVTLGDVVPWSHYCGAAGEWADVRRQLKQCILLRD
jgi:hypothetical protein